MFNNQFSMQIDLICSSFQFMEIIVNISTIDNFKVSIWGHWVCDWKVMSRIQSYKPVQAGFKTYCSHWKIWVRYNVSQKKHMLANSVEWMFTWKGRIVISIWGEKGCIKLLISLILQSYIKPYLWSK